MFFLFLFSDACVLLFLSVKGSASKTARRALLTESKQRRSTDVKQKPSIFEILRHVGHCLMGLFLYVFCCWCANRSGWLPPSPLAFTYSRWAPTLPSSYLWSPRIFPSLHGSRLPNFYRDKSSALLLTHVLALSATEEITQILI